MDSVLSKNLKAEDCFDLNGVTVHFRRFRRSKRLRLTVDHITGAVKVSGPLKTSLEQARRFAQNHADWIRKHTQTHTPKNIIEPGQKLYIQGEPITVQRQNTLRGVVFQDNGQLWVPGAPESFGRRVQDHLKSEARIAFQNALNHHVSHLRTFRPEARTLGRLTLRDTRSRWGSCSARGDISLNWRLILAPPFVLDYVTAHEVAHLAEHNHSIAFWAVCSTLSPDLSKAQSWLKHEGAKLHHIFFK